MPGSECGVVVLIDEEVRFVVVGEMDPRASEMGGVDLRGDAPWRPPRLGGFMEGPFETD